MTNNHGEYLEVKGDLSYQGIESGEMKKRYPQEVIYSQEDDVHQPTLTVSQTLQLALRCKTPSQTLGGISNTEFRQSIIDTLLSMLNIRHTKDTIVGNEFVRGVSGGERKRVSVAEAFCSQASVIAWDNSTRGLE